MLAALVVAIGLVSLAIPSVRRLIANPTAQAAVVGVDEVLVRGDSFQGHVFDPPVLQVPAGTTITWSFADRGASGGGAIAPHNVVGAGFGSPVIEAGTWSHTFATPGSYPYVCTLHGNMRGRVEVVAP
jgi:plastocyanin